MAMGSKIQNLLERPASEDAHDILLKYALEIDNEYFKDIKEPQLMELLNFFKERLESLQAKIDKPSNEVKKSLISLLES